MAGETDLKVEPVQEPVEPEPVPMRPVAPEVLAILERGRKIHERMSAIRVDIRELVDELVTRFPGYKKQIADVLEGENQRLLKEHHDEQQEARRNGPR